LTHNFESFSPWLINPDFLGLWHGRTSWWDHVAELNHFMARKQKRKRRFLGSHKTHKDHAHIAKDLLARPHLLKVLLLSNTSTLESQDCAYWPLGNTYPNHRTYEVVIQKFSTSESIHHSILVFFWRKQIADTETYAKIERKSSLSACHILSIFTCIHCYFIFKYHIISSRYWNTSASD
jgi:hypothetical protein